MKIFDSMLNAVDKLVDSEVNDNNETVVNEETTGEEKKSTTWKWVAVGATGVLVAAVSIWGGKKLLKKKAEVKETAQAEEPAEKK